ncbi:MAG: HAMP domain-containing sensor histidine kinase [Sulfurimonadaceae bacterium]|nr:HAMP domain-containing sensor histidine kinase [Sulfurimonadaceae bacterium]
MAEMTRISKEELTSLYTRIQEMERDRSYLQLIVRLMNRMGTVSGLDEVIESMLQSVLHVIDGNNTVLCYKMNESYHYHDAKGMKRVIDKCDDQQLNEVGESRYPKGYENSDGTHTWVFPLIVGKEVIGAFKMEHLNVVIEDLFDEFPIFFNYAALILRNEIMGYSRLKEANEHLEKKTADLERAYAQLQELDRLKTMFIASMSHELRTPLNSIIGFTSLLIEGMVGPLEEKQLEYLKRANSSGKHLLGLVSDIIDISKIEAGRLEIMVEDFDLEVLLDEAIDSAKALVKSKPLTIEKKIDHPVTIHSDRRRVLQCVLNFLSNAVKFSEAGTVTITAQMEDNNVVISVQDRGIGISEEDLSRLFAAFERIDSHLSVQAGGTGLGLYLTKKIVEGILGGEVFVTSRLGEGSTFGMRILQSIPDPQPDRMKNNH